MPKHNKPSHKKKLPLCRLREIRKAQGKSTRELIELSGVPRSVISYIEQGRGEGLPSTHLHLARALGVPLDEYFGTFSSSAASSEDKILKAGSDYSVEMLCPVPGSDLSVKRLHMAPQKTCEIIRYVNPKRPAFFYLAQSECKVHLGYESQLLRPGDHMGAPAMGKLKVENLTSLPLTLLIIQT